MSINLWWPTSKYSERIFIRPLVGLGEISDSIFTRDLSSFQVKTLHAGWMIPRIGT